MSAETFLVGQDVKVIAPIVRPLVDPACIATGVVEVNRQRGIKNLSPGVTLTVRAVMDQGRYLLAQDAALGVILIASNDVKSA